MIDLQYIAEPSANLKSELDAAWKRVLARNDVGFTKIPEDDAAWSDLEKRLEEVGHPKRLLVIGIGGSSLGTQVIHQCFRGASAVEIFFLESADPARWNLLCSMGPDWRDSHIAIVSKSGGTLETLSWVEKLAAQTPSWLTAQNCTVIASPGHGVLQNWAEREKIPSLRIPQNVGGRFSVLTAAGMFPAGLMGLSLFEFRQGARWALENIDLATKVSASILASWQRGEWITQMWTYSDSLRMFGPWWQQLWSESLGKKLDRNGAPAPRASTPISCLGPRDQHSLLQQLIEGYRDKHVLLTRVKGMEMDEPFLPKLFPEASFFGRQVSLGKVLTSEATAFEQSMIDSGIRLGMMELEGLTEKGLGALFMFWQVVIAQVGEHIGINAFDQPGVELGKKHTNRILSE